MERLKNQSFADKSSNRRRPPANVYRPFWLPAPNFYVLATILAVAVFFISWAFLNESEEEKPLISAGLLASMILAGAVILREVILRSARYKILLAQERIDHNISAVQKRNPDFQKIAKLSLDKNKEILRQIESESRTAQTSGKLPEAHWQVFELCHQYLEQTARELEFAKIGSPRIHVLRQSRERVQNLHQHHLMAWSSLESRALIKEAKICVTISKKLENANKALNVLDSAIEFYPNDAELHESVWAVKEFIATVKVSHWIEQAERFAFKKNYKRAIDHYRDALFYLARENTRTAERDSIAEKINAEIEKLEKISNEREGKLSNYSNE